VCKAPPGRHRRPGDLDGHRCATMGRTTRETDRRPMMVATRSTTEPGIAASTDVVVPAEAASTDAVVDRTLHTRAWLRERIDGRVGLAVGIAWVVLMQIAFALEPASNHEVPVIGLLLELSMYALLATMIAGLLMQQRFGLVASLGAAVLATAASIACPVS